MFAFKVLNLKICSEKLIMILLALSIGLIALIFSSVSEISSPLPHIPMPWLIFLLSLNYALYGFTFSEINKKENFKTAIILIASYLSALILPFLIFRNQSIFISILFSVFSVFSSLLLYKKNLIIKSAFLSLSVHFITSLYLFYLSLSLFF